MTNNHYTTVIFNLNRRLIFLKNCVFLLGAYFYYESRASSFIGTALLKRFAVVTPYMLKCGVYMPTWSWHIDTESLVESDSKVIINMVT